MRINPGRVHDTVHKRVIICLEISNTQLLIRFVWLYEIVTAFQNPPGFQIFMTTFLQPSTALHCIQNLYGFIPSNPSMASISAISVSNFFCNNHHTAKFSSSSSILQPRLRVSAANSAASTSSSGISRVTSSGSANLEVGSSSSAMEQLDIERGVCIPFRKYTPETVRNKVLESRGQILSLVGRGVEIVWNLGLYWSTLMYDCLVGRDEEVVPYRARQLRNLLCDLGPSFIKAGQVLANRPDIIREDYMNELCILQDDVPPFPNQVAFSIIEEELGQPLEAIFSKISSQTIAAASLGQVYRATLRDSGEDVAIKVIKGLLDDQFRLSLLCWGVTA